MGSTRGAETVLLGVLLFTPVALAGGPAPDIKDPSPGDAYVNPGVLLSLSPRFSGSVLGLGAELSYHRFIGPQRMSIGTWGLGGFAQWQVMNFQYHRLCAGIQGTGGEDLDLLGVELGLAHTTAGDGKAATTSVHIAPFLSLGFATASLRFGLPLPGGSRDQPSHGIEAGFTLALKVPVKL